MVRREAAHILDFGKQLKDLNLPSSEELTAAAKKIGGLKDLEDLMAASRDTADFLKKAKVLNEKLIRDVAQGEQAKLTKENKDLQALDAFKPTSVAIQELSNKFDSAIVDLSTTFAPQLLSGFEEIKEAIDSLRPYFDKIVNFIKAIDNARSIRGIFKVLTGN